jgi:hypothetical protein
VNAKPGIDAPADESAQESATLSDRRSFLAAGAAAALTATFSPQVLAQSARSGGDTKFKRVPTQYIAALGDPDATSGTNAQTWGLWRRDPGPRGVDLGDYGRLASSGVAPAGWKFDGTGWWLEEHGLIMESPEFPMPAGKYLVTGNRDVSSVLTVDPMDADGKQHWSLADGASIYDVTHLRCRSALYTPAGGAGACSPAKARPSDFPVRPGAPMPPVAGCNKQDYAVLIVYGVAVTNS